MTTVILFLIQVAKYEYVMQIARSSIICPFKYCIMRNKTCLCMALLGPLLLNTMSSYEHTKLNICMGRNLEIFVAKKFYSVLCFFSSAFHVPCSECRFMVITVYYVMHLRCYDSTVLNF
jgi:hypothetical protein